MKIYIAGPMRGHKWYNFPAFDEARDLLLEEGHEPLSPADIDRENGFDEMNFDQDVHDWSSWPFDLGPVKDIIKRDVDTILACDAIYMLDGWEKSTGASAEKAIAEWLGLTILFQTSPPQDEDILEEALRITGGDRQNSYGPPDQDFRRTAIMWEQLLNHRIKDGKLALEPADVAMCMIALKLSRETHQKKRDNAVDIAGYARCLQLCNDAERDTP